MNLNDIANQAKAKIQSAAEALIPKANNGINPEKANNTGNLLDQLTRLQDDNQYSTSIMSRGLLVKNIKMEDWNRFYPYKISILEIVNGKYEPKYTFDLPISPQSLVVSNPFAINNLITSRGVMEEHNGAPVRQIQLNGTTGIMIKRPDFLLNDKPASNAQTIFAGTISAVDSFQSALNNLVKKPTTSSITGNASPTSELFYSGYYQYHILKALLETYAEIKKGPNGKSFRLGLYLGKDKEFYLITPQLFSSKKDASSPLEYNYTLQALAWGSLDPAILTSKAKEDSTKVLNNNLSNYQDMLNRLRLLRGVVQSGKEIISAVKTDVEINVIGPMNNIIVAVKELLSIPHTLADMTESLKKSFETNITNQLEQIKSAVSPGISVKLDEGFGQAAVESIGGASIKTSENPIRNPLTDPNVTDAIEVQALSLTSEQQNSVDALVLESLSKTTDDVKVLLYNMEATVTALEPVAEAQGADSPVWPILYALNDGITSMYSLIANDTFGTTTAEQRQSGYSPLIETYKSLSAQSGINYVAPVGKFSVPFPFRGSLEQLALTYLGDASRWPEIASVNNLQSPYIDEDGFIYSFLSNGSGRIINVASSLNLFVGQKIYLSSNTQQTTARKIQIIQKVSDSSYLITVDGADNMDQFKASESASLKAYLPNTINSLSLIYIPTQVASSISSIESKSLPFINEDPELLRLSRVDLLLDSSGDLAVSKDGFFNLAFGKANIIQASKLKMTMIAGKNLLHPEYGAGVEVGESEADLDVNDIRSRIVQSFLSDDRFSRVNSIEIVQSPGTISMNLNVQASQLDVVVPLSFKF